MNGMYVIQGRKWLRGIVLVAVLLLAAYWIWSAYEPGAPLAITASAPADAVEKEFEIVTVEYHLEKEGRPVGEVYRWDPGFIAVNKGDRVRLKLHGVRGESHPFLIEGLGIRGEVSQGQETVVEFVAEKEGTYRLICLNHMDKASNGPMIGYIVVQ